MLGCKCHLICLCIINFDLSVSAIDVERQKYGRFAKLVYAFVHEWFQVRVRLGYGVPFTIVVAELVSSVLFGDRYYLCGPFRLCVLDDILGQHLINLSFFKLTRFRISSVRC